MGIFDFFKGNRKTDTDKNDVVIDPTMGMKEPESEDRGMSPRTISWSIWPEVVEDVAATLKDEVATAQSQNLRVLIYTYAAWSPGSAAFRKAQHDREFAALLSGKVHVVDVHFDTMNKLNELGFDGYSIPQLYLLEEDGSYRGVTITGAAWGADLFENITRVLRKWFKENGID